MHPLLRRVLVHQLSLGIGTPAHSLHHARLLATHDKARWVLTRSLLLHAHSSHHARLLTLHAHRSHLWLSLLHASHGTRHPLRAHHASTHALTAHGTSTHTPTAHHSVTRHAATRHLLLHLLGLLTMMHLMLFSGGVGKRATLGLYDVILASLDAIVFDDT